MADGVDVTPGTGRTIATDLIAGQDYQRVKLIIGADGTNDGDISATNPLPVTGVVASSGLTDTQLRATAVPVSGTFYQATQPVSGTFWQATQPVSGTFWQATQPVSAAALPLPTGASTAAKQPALGTAGTASADVISVQGVASMTALKVDGSAVTQPVSGTFWQATQPVSGSVAATQSGTWTVQPGNTANTTAWKVDGSAVTQPVSGTFWQATQPISGTVTINAIPAGTNNIGDVDVLTIAAGANAIGDVGLTTRTTGGLTAAKLISAATTNATSTKGSAGRLHIIHAINLNAAARYLKFYNKASAPTVGSDTPVLTFAIPGNTAGAGFTLASELGWAFATGIALALTTAAADADTGAVAANEIILNLGYA